MAKRKRKNLKKNKKILKKRFALPEETKKWLWGSLLFILAIIFTLSFFNLAGPAGKIMMTGLNFLIGKVVFVLPLILVLAGLIFLRPAYQNFGGPLILAILILISGIAGVLEGFNPGQKEAGIWGFLVASPFLKFFSFWVAQIIFSGMVLLSGIIFWQLLKPKEAVMLPEKEKKALEEKPEKISLIKKILAPKFKVKEIPPVEKILTPELKAKPIEQKLPILDWQPPPLELLEKEKEVPSAGDTRTNSAIIKKTLENFAIPVEMSEINIGPTVTQYTLKPAEGIKLSKITALSNDLALALASHPIRIEAPIPGRALVGIEVPNKTRARVRLRDLIENPDFQRAPSNLAFVLGRDVSGNPVYADLARMPHLLVAGSTGTGKTIYLNSLILSLLYQNSPQILRLILIDPKRVEFPIYNELPHLLSPVIYDAQMTINALKWLIAEMERRFEVLSEAKARDIASYNEQVIGMLNAESKSAEKNIHNSKFIIQNSVMPYLILIIDELADLMAARGREVEAGIVRLAQMARAVGIHLVVATQRPSVEVITGLIKANITSRITFQVASQIDSRTVLDMAGAEKLLGLGDMLYLSAEITKPRRIQSAYVSEKEVKRVVNYIKSNIKYQISKIGEKEILENKLAEGLRKTLELPEMEFESLPSGEDPLYEEAKRVVIQARKGSASLLQRRLRIGYARAARLLDILEERGVVGPGSGAKPRDVYFESDEHEIQTR